MNFYLSKLSASEPDADYPFVPDGRALPMWADLRMFDSPIENQLNIGSCVANALVGACELIMKRAGLYQSGTGDLARLFLYYYARALDNLQGQDGGAVPRSGCKAAQKFGVPFETTYPYEVARVLDEPTEAARIEALQMRITRYERVTLSPDDYRVGVDQCKAAIAQGIPVTIAMRVYAWFREITGPLSTHWQQPGPGNPRTDPRFQVIGNHQMLIVGYDDRYVGGGAFIVKNSWGDGWGDGGYWAMPITYMHDAFECWAIRGFMGAGDVAPGDEAPLPDAVIAAAREWAVQHGLGRWDTGGFVYEPRVDLGHYIAGAAARANGFSDRQYAGIIGMDPLTVEQFMGDPAKQPLINAFAQEFAP